MVYFKLVLDKDNGKRKSYDLWEYLDEETALSACRNLDDSMIRDRHLRVNLSSKPSSAPSVQENDERCLTLHLARTHSTDQLRVIIENMYSLPREDKEQSHNLFSLCPHLPKALFQALQMAQPHHNNTPSHSVAASEQHSSKQIKLEDGWSPTTTTTATTTTTIATIDSSDQSHESRPANQVPGLDTMQSCEQNVQHLSSDMLSYLLEKVKNGQQTCT